MSSNELKESIKIRQGQDFRHSRHRDWKKSGSRERELKNQKKSSTGEVNDIREENTAINLTKGHKMLIFNEDIYHL